MAINYKFYVSIITYTNVYIFSFYSQGSKDIDESLLACRKYTRLLQNAGIRVCFQNFHIQNIVASVGVPFPLKLQQLAVDHGPYVSYESALFPGAVLRVENPKVVFLLFRSGKIVITGKFYKVSVLYSNFKSNTIPTPHRSQGH